MMDGIQPEIPPMVDFETFERETERELKGGKALPNDPRPMIRIVAGEVERIVDEAENALIKANRGLYQRDNKIVFVAFTPAKTSTGENTVAIQILERGEHALIVDMSSSANFERFDKRCKDWIPADPPISIVKALQQHGLGRFRLPPLHGVITAPTMRADGSILDAPGYDAATGLLFTSDGVRFPRIPDRPTSADAVTALASLDALVNRFPFVKECDRSVALSAILTACVRRSLPTAPLHAFSSPTAGTGKGKLTDIACVISTGYMAAPLGPGANDEELEKRLASKLIAAEPFISIDNCTRPLGGELICSMLTQERVSPRVLGFSKASPIETGAFCAANGNNLVIEGDLIRRTLLCQIDAKVELPETRVFDRDPVAFVKANRPALVVAVLTILRAYHVAGRPGRPAPLGSFETWSDLVRGALIWLECADPVDTMKTIREADPVVANIKMVMSAWRETFAREPLTVSQVIKAATEQTRSDSFDGRFEFSNEALREALLTVAGRGGAINSRALGHWLSANKSRIVDGDRFEQFGTRQGAAVWALAIAATYVSPQ
jgi:putative DNA primase/helicase